MFSFIGKMCESITNFIAQFFLLVIIVLAVVLLFLATYRKNHNPYIDHRLYDISLNSISKFRERCLATLLDYYNDNAKLPKALTFSFAALLAFYLKYSDREYELRDSEENLHFFEAQPKVGEILARIDMWGEDLNAVGGLCETIEKHLDSIQSEGIVSALKEVVYE